MIDRAERGGLCLETDDQLGRLDAGETRNVVDRLLGIQRRTLPSGIVEHVDDVAVEADHAALEHGKQAHRPRPYDDDVGLLSLSVGHDPKLTHSPVK